MKNRTVKSAVVSWQTTLSGAVAALGEYIQNATGPSWFEPVGEIMVIVGMFALGATARQGSKSSQDHGLRS